MTAEGPLEAECDWWKEHYKQAYAILVDQISMINKGRERIEELEHELKRIRCISDKYEVWGIADKALAAAESYTATPKWHCEACEFEAKHGTREVPHPVHSSIHNCVNLANAAPEGGER